MKALLDSALCNVAAHDFRADVSSDADIVCAGPKLPYARFLRLSSEAQLLLGG